MINETQIVSPALDHEIASVLSHFPVVSHADVGPETLAAFRSGTLPMELSDGVERLARVVRADPELSVRIHRKKGAQLANAPCVFSMHGGGYVAGSVDIDDGFFDALCQKTGCVGISVDYRLAPEAPYPLPLEDCYAALAWVFERADEIGIDPKRVGIHGISAGGGLAAALALMVRDRGEFKLAFQALDCPMLDWRQTTVSSRAEGLVGWTKESNEFGWRSYLGDLYGSDDVPYLASPALAKDLSGLPPAYISVGGADGFRDECVAYALRMGECAVPYELHVFPGAPHPVMLFQNTDVGARYVRDKMHWLALRIEETKAQS